MRKYFTKQVEVDAFRWGSNKERPQWIIDALNIKNPTQPGCLMITGELLFMRTSDGNIVMVQPGSWVVRGPLGEMFTMLHEVFNRYFEPSTSLDEIVVDQAHENLKKHTDKTVAGQYVDPMAVEIDRRIMEQYENTIKSEAIKPEPKPEPSLTGLRRCSLRLMDMQLQGTNPCEVCGDGPCKFTEEQRRMPYVQDWEQRAKPKVQPSHDRPATQSDDPMIGRCSE
jgi:hypothetical protein